MTVQHFSFIGGRSGQWQVTHMEAVIGEGLPPVSHLDHRPSQIHTLEAGMTWVLRGVTSHARYLHRAEKDALTAIQPTLGRSDATCAALIPIKKSAEWWALPQDERRAVVEDQSRHIANGMRYLPAIARRLHHGYDLNEPFDFLTWFEYAPNDADRFEELTRHMRLTEEWRYVEREIDLRLLRA